MATFTSSGSRALWVGPAVVLLAVSLGSFSPPAGPAENASLPPGPGANLVQQHCLTCHDADLIVQQRLTRARWDKDIDKMIRWGATVPAAARERLVTYLVTHFGEASRAASAGAATVLPSAPGADQVQRACLTCHGADIIAGQYLTRAQWGKELDKMARWGALFSSEERAAMLDYLASHFGPEATEAR